MLFDEILCESSATWIIFNFGTLAGVHQLDPVCVVANARDASVPVILEIRLFPNTLRHWRPFAGICPWAGPNFNGCLQQEAMVNENDIP